MARASKISSPEFVDDSDDLLDGMEVDSDSNSDEDEISSNTTQALNNELAPEGHSITKQIRGPKGGFFVP